MIHASPLKDMQLFLPGLQQSLGSNRIHRLELDGIAGP
jgi:hypothetical protein